MSQEFSNLLTSAVNDHYNHTFFGTLERQLDSEEPRKFGKRLKAVVQNQLLEFSKDMLVNRESLIIHDPDNDDEAKVWGASSIWRHEYIEQVKMVFSKGSELSGLLNPMTFGNLFWEQCLPLRGIIKELREAILMAAYSTT